LERARARSAALEWGVGAASLVVRDLLGVLVLVIVARLRFREGVLGVSPVGTLCMSVSESAPSVIEGRSFAVSSSSLCVGSWYSEPASLSACDCISFSSVRPSRRRFV